MSCDDGRVSLVQVHREADLGKESDPGAATSTPASASSASTPALTREPDLQRESPSSVPSSVLHLFSHFYFEMLCGCHLNFSIPCFLFSVKSGHVLPNTSSRFSFLYLVVFHQGPHCLTFYQMSYSCLLSTCHRHPSLLILSAELNTIAAPSCSHWITFTIPPRGSC